jgi:hypothetical protein
VILPTLTTGTRRDPRAALAREIAGTDASLEIQDLARRITEAQIDLRCVQSRAMSFFREGSVIQSRRSRNSNRPMFARTLFHVGDS